MEYSSAQLQCYYRRPVPADLTILKRYQIDLVRLVRFIVVKETSVLTESAIHRDSRKILSPASRARRCRPTAGLAKTTRQTWICKIVADAA